MTMPTIQDAMRVLSEHFGMPMSEVIKLLRVPTHPATLRDEFAGLAMQACPMPQGHMHDTLDVYQRIASHAYKMADALLSQRAKGAEL